jgi:N-acyl homoserine lactone hydrolase
MHIHAIRTGQIAVKNSYVEAKGNNRLMRLASVLLDPTFRDIPIYAWVIEHPEGLMVIDTGETALVNEPEYFPVLQRPYWKTQYRFDVAPEDEIGAQMRRLGLPPEEVRWLIQTHAHFDHTDALYYFPNSRILFSRKEYEDVTTYRSAHFAFPSKWPHWLKPQLVDYVPQAVGPFSQSFTVTQAGDVQIVPTPGHTLGHQSVLLHEGDVTYFFGGDTSFDLPSLLSGVIDAPAFNAHKTLETRQKILDYACDTPLVYLTTHDPETANRLHNKETLQVGSSVKPVQDSQSLQQQKREPAR